MTEIAGRINPMVAMCRRVAWLAAVEGNKTKGGPGAAPMSAGRRLDIYTAATGSPYITQRQRRRMWHKRSKHMDYADGSRPGSGKSRPTGLPVFDATARKVGLTPEVPPSWERPTTMLPLVGA